MVIWNPSEVALSLGAFEIRWYSLMWCAGLAAAYYIVYALYKPLADRDSEKISQVIASGSSFFRKLGGILVVYVAALVIFFPLFVDRKYGFVFDATLILAMSISHFTRYYFGLVDSLLLKADQKAYIINVIDTVTLIINTLFCYGLLFFGVSYYALRHLLPPK